MKMISHNYWSKLSSDYEAVLKNDDQYDVIIEAGECSDVTKFWAHSFVLRVKCSYFKAAFENAWSEKTDDGHYIFKKPNISAKVFKVILRYLYTGVIRYNLYDTDTLMRCLVAADELGLLKLIGRVEDYLCNHSYIFETDVISSLEIIHKVKSVKRLTDCCLEMISASPEVLLSYERFSKLDLPFMKKVLKREDLNMSVNVMWDVLIRWITVHCLIGQPDSVRSWEERQSQAKAAIKVLIPLIGIYDMPWDDFNTKVLPYVELLPLDLIISVLDHHLKPLPELPKGYKRARRPEPNSVLIQPEVFDLFTKWIHSTNTSVRRLSFKFRLLFRGSRNGFDAATFHKCCDYKGATIVVSKITNFELLIGGYNPLSWASSDQALTTCKSFIFTLNPNDMKSAKFSRIKRDYVDEAVYDYRNKGPTFGRSLDLLFMKGNISKSNTLGKEYHPRLNKIVALLNFCDYERKFTSTPGFQIQECEVFQVVKNTA